MIDGSPALTLTTDDTGGVEATFVPSADMVGCSLRHRGQELLGQRGGLRTYIAERSTMGMPLLHPWANRLARTRFSVAGAEVDLDDAITVTRDPNGLPMHGLLAAAVGWRVNRHEATDNGGVLAASFDFADHRELMAAFPFPHEVLFEASLRGSTLTIATTVVASVRGPCRSPSATTPTCNFRASIGPTGRWRCLFASAWSSTTRMLPTGAREHVQVEAGPLGARTFDDAYLAPSRELRSCSPAAAGELSSRSDPDIGSPRCMHRRMTTWSPTSQ
jgi:aldose 1-epimerase